MSQYPYPYDPALGYAAATPSLRPISVTVLAIIGIVLGALALCCAGLSTLLNAFIIASGSGNPMGLGIPVMPIEIRVASAVLSLIAMLLAIILLVGSVMALSLKPAALRIMRFWSLAVIVFASGQLILHIVWIAPATLQGMKQSAGPLRQTGFYQIYAQFGTAMLVGSAVISWALYCTLPVCILMLWRRPEVEAAFGPTPRLEPGEGRPFVPPAK